MYVSVLIRVNAHVSYESTCVSASVRGEVCTRVSVCVRLWVYDPRLTQSGLISAIVSGQSLPPLQVPSRCLRVRDPGSEVPPKNVRTEDGPTYGPLPGRIVRPAVTPTTNVLPVRPPHQARRPGSASTSARASVPRGGRVGVRRDAREPLRGCRPYSPLTLPDVPLPPDVYFPETPAPSVTPS